MRKEHELEKRYANWKKAVFEGKELHPIQEQETKRAFMSGIFEGLNFFVIDQMENPNAECDIEQAYKFLKQFAENEVKVHKKSPPYGKRFYK